jgi:uncharacterized membrane protein YccF (DUF307 family)
MSAPGFAGSALLLPGAGRPTHGALVGSSSDNAPPIHDPGRCLAAAFRQQRCGTLHAYMRLVLNVIWFVFAGLWTAIGYAIAALIMFILIITIPFGVAALRIGIFALWPFGKTVVRRPDAGFGSAIGNVVWFLLAGWWLILLHLLTGTLLCLTIIGIPLGLANFKLIPVTFRPFGRDIVSIDEAERQGLPHQVAVPS